MRHWTGQSRVPSPRPSSPALVRSPSFAAWPRSVVTLLLWVAICILSGCRNESTDEPEKLAPKRLSVAVVNAPLRYFAKRIAGEEFEIVDPVPAGIDPRTWRPDSAGISQLQAASLVLVNGANFSPWLAIVSLPQAKVINTSEPFADQYIPLEDSFVHRHGPQGGRSEEEWASTTWLDFKLAVRQAESILNALVDLDPEKTELLKANFQLLADDLHTLDQECSRIAESLRAVPLITASPEYQYLARGYQLDIQALDWGPDFELDAARSEQLKQLLEKRPAQWLICPQPPSTEVQAELRDQFQIQTVTFDPLARNAADQDWLSAMRENLRRLELITDSSDGR